MLRLSPLLAVGVVLLGAGEIRAEPILWALEEGGNGHYYNYVPGRLRWSEARAAAEASVFAGVQGYLATLTFEAEKEFLRNSVPKPSWRAWLGGFQDTTADDYAEPGGGWRWITDEPWDYSNWARPEPNNFLGGENVLEMDRAADSPDAFGWSDQSDYESTNSGYYVEYAVPEPSSLVLLAAGAAGLVAYVLRVRRVALPTNFLKGKKSLVGSAHPTFLPAGRPGHRPVIPALRLNPWVDLAGEPHDS